jgi:RNA polymerase sigma-70 factor (ECF subfamily)
VDRRISGASKGAPDGRVKESMVNDSSDDQELLQRMAQGDEAAFGALYSRYRKRIFRFAWHMSENDAMAEEITQEVFMHLIQNPRRYDPAKGPLPAYM